MFNSVAKFILKQPFKSIMGVLVMFKGFQKLVVFPKGLSPARVGHVEASILHFLFPISDWFSSFISMVDVNQLPQFLVFRYLPPLFKAIALLQFIINRLKTNNSSTLVSHDQSTNNIGIQWLWHKCRLMRGCKLAFPFFLYLPPLLLLQFGSNLFQILCYSTRTISYVNWVFFPTLAKVSALFVDFP